MKNYTEAWNDKYNHLGQAIYWTIVLHLFAWLSSRHLNNSVIVLPTATSCVSASAVLRESAAGQSLAEYIITCKTTKASELIFG